MRERVALADIPELIASGQLMDAKSIIGISLGAALSLRLAQSGVLPIERLVLLRPAFTDQSLPANLAVFLARAPIVLFFDDDDLLHRALFNLTLNAIQAVGPGGRVTVDVATSPPKGDKEAMARFNPDLSKYQAVVSNYNGEPWPDATQQAFEKYMQSGGGLVVVHAANNAFPKWDEWNRMIGLGGWGGRNEKSGPYVRFRDGQIVKDETAGQGGSRIGAGAQEGGLRRSPFARSGRWRWPSPGTWPWSSGTTSSVDSG